MAPAPDKPRRSTGVELDLRWAGALVLLAGPTLRFLSGLPHEKYSRIRRIILPSQQPLPRALLLPKRYV